MRVALVVNPRSGTRRGEHIARRAAHELGELGHEIDVIRGVDGAEAGARLRAGLERAGKPDVVAVVGGDGALHQLLPSLVEHELTAAMIPAGTGNDVARQLGVGEPTAAIQAIHHGHTRTIDLIDVGDGLVATVVASGFDSKVNERANAMSWPKGNLRYNSAIVAELRAFEPLHFTIEADGQSIERDAMLVAVGNMPSFGGGLRIAEGAEDDDGLLDVIVIHPVSKLKLLWVFPMLYRGAHVNLPEFERIRAKQVTWNSPGIVAYGDGECLGPLPLTATAKPGALTMVHA
ncbi:MAG TPA: diacylglycerol kinase family protein [Aeromicrobium sp.]|nr:diacylglycerol kinase family protein [Aeromicrobium sp.]